MGTHRGHEEDAAIRASQDDGVKLQQLQMKAAWKEIDGQPIDVANGQDIALWRDLPSMVRDLVRGAFGKHNRVVGATFATFQGGYTTIVK